MTATKKIFKTEINRIGKLSALFSFNLKLNGRQVILSEDNQKKLKEVTNLLDMAVNKLSEIK
jgi:hypothetical protein